MQVLLPPILERQLRMALRAGTARRLWWKAASSFGAVTLLLWGFGLLTSVDPQGRWLFSWLFVIGLWVVVSHGLKLTADLFSEERRQGTLGLLYLAGLSTSEIFLSKLAGAALTTSYSLLAGVPFLAVPLVAGGVSGAEFLSALVCLAVGLLVVTALGVLGSVVHRDSGAAQMTAVLVGVALCLLGPLIGAIVGAFASGKAPWIGWLVSSPAYGPWLILRRVGHAPELLWANSGLSLGYAMAALVLAGRILHRTWRDETGLGGLSRWRARWLAWRRGSAAWRDRRRTQVLAEDPVGWLASRDRACVWAAWVWVTVSGVGCLASVLLAGRGWGGWLAMVGAAGVNVGFRWIVLYAAAGLLGEARRSGILELLLTTPLCVEDIIAGQRRALWLQFKPVFWAVAVLDLVLVALGLRGWTGSLAATSSYLAVWAAILGLTVAGLVSAPLRAMWISLWTGRPAYAALQGIAGSAVAFLLLLLTLLVTNWARFGNEWWVACPLWATVAGGAVCSGGELAKLRTKLVAEFRLIAAAPIPQRNDPRFRGWSPDSIFPPGRWGDFQLRPAQKPRSSRAGPPAGSGG